MPPSARRNHTPGSAPKPGLHLDGLKSDVVGILEHRYAASPIKSNIELARQAIQRAFIKNVEVPLARVGTRIDQFVRINAGRRCAGDIPDIVGTGPSRAQAEVLDRLHDVDRTLRFDLAHLQICARSNNAVNIVEAIQDLGLCSRGAGADNIRNVTGTPTAGIDPHELIDTRPYAREWHFHILNERALYGLPRKFNVGFDGAGRRAHPSLRGLPTTSGFRPSR